jgi:hypothetical protein
VLDGSNTFRFIGATPHPATDRPGTQSHPSERDGHIFTPNCFHADNVYVRFFLCYVTSGVDAQATEFAGSLVIQTRQDWHCKRECQRPQYEI